MYFEAASDSYDSSVYGNCICSKWIDSIDVEENSNSKKDSIIIYFKN